VWSVTIQQKTSSSLERDLDDLRAALGRLPFPALQDDVIAALVARRAPSRLLWRSGSLSRTRLYRSVDEICADIARPRGVGHPPPPGR
jgi:hypothetical protein